jgi:hypothetical protein
MATMQQFLEMDGNIGFNLAIYNRFSTIGDSVYAEICGGFIDGVYQWANHNIDDVSEVSNAKYVGWIIQFSNGAERKVYIPHWVMDKQPVDWKHAKNLFNKYLRVAPNC